MACVQPDKFYPPITTLALPKGSLAGKIALVTGGGTGIGKAIASTLAALGAKVAIAARRLDVLETTATEIMQKTGGTCIAIRMDIKDPVQVASAVDECERRLGGLPNILINNAAGNFIMATERLSDNAAGTIIDIVLKGTFRVTREVGRRCIAQGTGCSVVSITTPYARTGGPFVVPSAVSKAGVESMTRSLATEWGKYGIRLNVVAPGPFPTEGAFSRLFVASGDQAAEAAKASVPEGRVGQLEELGNLVSYIVSDYGSFLNGAIIDIDGGQQHMNAGLGTSGPLHEMTNADWQGIEDTIRAKTNKQKKSKI